MLLQNIGEYKKFALSFKGGTARGMGAIGVMRFFQEENLKPTIVAGSSAGSIIASAYALGIGWEKLQELLDNYNFMRLVTLKSFLRDGSFVNRKRYEDFLRPYCSDIRIEDLPVKLVIYASSLKTKQRYFIEKGSVLQAIVASCSYPVFFPSPTYIDGEPMIDGDLISSFSSNFLKSRGAEVVIGVGHRNIEKTKPLQKWNIVNKLFSIYNIASGHINMYQDVNDPPDYKIIYNTTGQSYFNFGLIDHTAKNAYLLTKKHKEEILKVISK
ncbi:MAG: patatin-like phospholipase family protein [bacterium]